jgi:hypothetical protein
VAAVDLGIEGYEDAVEIGRGGFAVVYKAWQPVFARHVAVKVISTVVDDTALQRFSRECAAIGKLSGHPNIVTVHGSGQTPDGRPYIVMEYLPGGTLGDQLVAGPLPWPEVAEIGVKLAGALASAHRAGVIHRDVKPENVLMSAYSDCKLGDFGIARVEGRTQTAAGVPAFSIEHVAPEVAAGQPPSTASDVYSLASTLYALLVGRSPFAPGPEEHWSSVLRRVVADAVPPLGPEVTEPVALVVAEGLAKEPGARPASAQEFGRRLQAAQRQVGRPVTPLPLEGDPGVTVEPGAVGTAPAAAPRRRLPWAVAAVLVSALVAAVVAWRAGTGGDGERDVSLVTSTTPVVATTGGVASTGAGSATTTVQMVPPAGGAVLGRDLLPATTESCRTPSVASGAAWQVGQVQMGGRRYDPAYSCNLFSGGTGGMDIVVGGSYQRLDVAIGFADGSGSTGHAVRFEVIGDGREYLTEPRTLRFGEIEHLSIDVTGVTRLELKVTEVNAARGSEAPSRPVFAVPTLT